MKPVFTQLIKLDKYLNSNRIHWDNFDNHKFDVLHSQIRETRIALQMYEADIQMALELWDKMSLDGSPPQSMNIIQVYLVSLSNALEEARRTSSALVTDAMHVKNTATDIWGSGKFYLAGAPARQAQYISDIADAQANAVAAQKRYNDARARLEGAGGVWTGFVTGITLGIYNRIKEQLDNAKAALKSYNGQIEKARNSMKNMNKQQNQIAEVTVMMQRLKTIDRSVANSLNVLNQANIIVGEAARKFVSAQEHDRPAVIAVLAKRGGTKMEQLRQWIQ